MDTTTIMILVAIVGIIAVIAGRLSHKFWPASVAETKLEAKVASIEATAEQDALHALAKAAAWVSDTSPENQRIAAANGEIAAATASMARKAALRKQFGSTFNDAS